MSSVAVVNDAIRVKRKDVNILLTPTPPPPMLSPRPMPQEVLFLYIRTREITNSCQFANNVDSDGMAHDEPPHLNLHCWPMVFEFLTGYSLHKTLFEILQT